MKAGLIPLFLASTAFAGEATPTSKTQAFFEREFKDKTGCFVLVNVKTGAVEEQFGLQTCRERLAPLSTFKIPLALMAFDSGFFKSPDQIIKWDGKDNGSPTWNKDQTPKTFMENSVIWVSRRIVDELGADKVKRYLKDFAYGNQSVDGDFHNFWLTSGSLKISPSEQAEFLAKLWTRQFPVSVQAISHLREVAKSGTVRGATVFGKTGSGCTGDVCDGPKAKHYGWFSGVIETENAAYSFALQYSDRLPSQDWAGPKAKKIFYRYLEEKVDQLTRKAKQ